MNIKLVLVSMITLLRVPAALVSGYFLLHQEWMFAWIAFIICVVTDVVDGRLARWWNVVSAFGTVADLWSDILIFWVYVPATYWYSQRHSPWWQDHLPPSVLLMILVVISLVMGSWILLTARGNQFKSWYLRKGNFWCGVIPVATIGCWMAWETGLLPSVITVLYGISALWLNRKKIEQYI